MAIKRKQTIPTKEKRIERARMGGLAGMAARTPEERSELGAMAAEKRWADPEQRERQSRLAKRLHPKLLAARRAAKLEKAQSLVAT